jgi:hypothetical protein
MLYSSSKHDPQRGGFNRFFLCHALHLLAPERLEKNLSSEASQSGEGGLRLGDFLLIYCSSVYSYQKVDLK